MNISDMYYRDPDGTVILSFGEDEEVVVDIQLRNVGEPAYETMLYTTVPEVFGWKDLDPVFPVRFNTDILLSSNSWLWLYFKF